jgi:hypothetical protein
VNLVYVSFGQVYSCTNLSKFSRVLSPQDNPICLHKIKEKIDETESTEMAGCRVKQVPEESVFNSLV